MSITVTPALVADLGVQGARMPVCAHLIDHGGNNHLFPGIPIPVQCPVRP